MGRKVERIHETQPQFAVLILDQHGEWYCMEDFREVLSFELIYPDFPTGLFNELVTISGYDLLWFLVRSKFAVYFKSELGI